jgi:hypothetical protein
MTYYAPKINPESSDPTRIFEKSTPVKKKRFSQRTALFRHKNKNSNNLSFYTSPPEYSALSETTNDDTMVSRFLSSRSSRYKDDNSTPTNMSDKKRNAQQDERTFLERYAMWSHQNPLLALTCIVLVAVGFILTVVLNDELQFVETNDREWVILKDGITSDADAAAEGTRLVEEYVYYY